MATASPNTIFGVNALLHVFILTAFLVVFYKVFVTKLETEAIHGELKKMLDKTLPDMFDKAEAATGTFKSAVQNMQSSGLLDKMDEATSKEDPQVTSYNNWLFVSSFLVILGLFVLLVATVILLTSICGLDIHFAAIIRENIVLFMAIGIAEFLFFTRIALHFVPASPSYMTQQLTTSLQNQFK